MTRKGVVWRTEEPTETVAGSVTSEMASDSDAIASTSVSQFAPNTERAHEHAPADEHVPCPLQVATDVQRREHAFPPDGV